MEGGDEPRGTLPEGQLYYHVTASSGPFPRPTDVNKLGLSEDVTYDDSQEAFVVSSSRVRGRIPGAATPGRYTVTFNAEGFRIDNTSVPEFWLQLSVPEIYEAVMAHMFRPGGPHALAAEDRFNVLRSKRK